MQQTAVLIFVAPAVIHCRLPVNIQFEVGGWGLVSSKFGMLLKVGYKRKHCPLRKCLLKLSLYVGKINQFIGPQLPSLISSSFPWYQTENFLRICCLKFFGWLCQGLNLLPSECKTCLFVFIYLLDLQPGSRRLTINLLPPLP